MITFNYVEDYLEYIAGYRTLSGQLHKNWYSGVYFPAVSLARYDVRIVDSISKQTIQGTPLTEKQANLVIKLIKNYQRQLSQQQVDVSPMQEPQFRMKVRQVNDLALATMEDQIHLKFKYNTDLIEALREERKVSQGHIVFNRETKEWDLGLTEYNVNFAYHFAKKHKFEIDDNLAVAMQAIYETEKTNFAIQLVENNSALEIKNAPGTLNEYIISHCGGFSADNWARLIDYAPVFGYTVEQKLLDRIAQTNKNISKFSNNKDSKLELPNLEPSTINYAFCQILEYAKLVNRWPVVVYEPAPHTPDLGLLNLIEKYFAPEEICLIDSARKDKITEKTKIVYSSKKIEVTENFRVPLLVSSIGMYFGGSKQLLLQQAEKIIYFSVDVHNKLDRLAQSVIIDMSCINAN